MNLKYLYNTDWSHDEKNEKEDVIAIPQIPFQAWMVVHGITSVLDENADKEIYIYIYIYTTYKRVRCLSTF